MARGGSRSGAGRPPVESLRKVRTFKVTDEEWQEIKNRVKQLGISYSEYIRRATLTQIK